MVSTTMNVREKFQVLKRTLLIFKLGIFIGSRTAPLAPLTGITPVEVMLVIKEMNFLYPFHPSTS